MEMLPFLIQRKKKELVIVVWEGTYSLHLGLSRECSGISWRETPSY